MRLLLSVESKARGMGKKIRMLRDLGDGRLLKQDILSFIRSKNLYFSILDEVLEPDDMVSQVIIIMSSLIYQNRRGIFTYTQSEPLSET